MICNLKVKQGNKKQKQNKKYISFLVLCNIIPLIQQLKSICIIGLVIIMLNSHSTHQKFRNKLGWVLYSGYVRTEIKVLVGLWSSGGCGQDSPFKLIQLVQRLVLMIVGPKSFLFANFGQWVALSSKRLIFIPCNLAPLQSQQ